MISPRERFLQIARFERPNDPWIFGLALWRATRHRWSREGLPLDTTPQAFLVGDLDRRASLPVGASVSGMGVREDGAMYRPALDPFFDPEILADDGVFVTKREYDGSVIRYNKADPGAMPQWLSYPVKNRQDWEIYKKRLDPHSPGRWPDGWDRMPDGRDWSERDVALCVNCLSLYGSARSYYMGLENSSIAMYDDPALMDTVAVRKWYGKNVIICGNVDKRALAGGKHAIDQELERCKFLLASGGFFPSCDHHIPPDVPLENMVYFVNELRKLSDFPETRRVVTL